MADGYSGVLLDSAGNSVAFSGIENFSITTGSGNDVIVTGDGNDSIAAGSGDDTISAGDGRDVLLVNYSDASTPMTGKSRRK